MVQCHCISLHLWWSTSYGITYTHRRRESSSALRTISYAGTSIDPLRKHSLLTSALLFSPLLQDHAMAGQFKNFNTFNKTLAILNQCPFHRNEVQGVRGKANTGSVQINLLMWKGHCQINSSSLKLPEGNRKT